MNLLELVMDEKIHTPNEKELEEFINHVRAQGFKERTVNTQVSNLNMFFNRVTKPFNDLTRNDLNQFFGNGPLKPTTKEIVKVTLKKFLRYHGRDDLAGFIQTNAKILSKPTKGDEAKLSPEEIDHLIECHPDLHVKALIETFIVTGGRKEEIRNLDLGDIIIDENLIWINIRESKTKVRKIPVAPIEGNPVARFPKYLVAYVQSRKDEPSNAPLFYTSNPRSGKRERLYYDGVYWIFGSLKKRLGWDKTLTPHILRHTAASYDGVTLNEAMLCQKYGWMLGSTMARNYCHFNEKQLANQVLKQAGLNEEEAKKGKVCPRCGEMNNLFAEVCEKCSQILDPKKLIAESLKQRSEMEALREEVRQLRTEKHFNEEQGRAQKQYDQMQKDVSDLREMLIGFVKSGGDVKVLEKSPLKNLLK